MLVVDADVTVNAGTLYTFTVTGDAADAQPFASVMVRPTWPEEL